MGRGQKGNLLVPEVHSDNSMDIKNLSHIYCLPIK